MKLLVHERFVYYAELANTKDTHTHTHTSPSSSKYQRIDHKIKEPKPSPLPQSPHDRGVHDTNQPTSDNISQYGAGPLEAAVTHTDPLTAGHCVEVTM